MDKTVIVISFMAKRVPKIILTVPHNSGNTVLDPDPVFYSDFVSNIAHIRNRSESLLLYHVTHIDGTTE